MVIVRDSDSPAGSILFFLTLKKPLAVLPSPRELNTVDNLIELKGRQNVAQKLRDLFVRLLLES